MSSPGAYGQLVSTTDATSDPIEIDDNNFTIGRKTSNCCLNHVNGIEIVLKPRCGVLLLVNFSKLR